MASIAGKNRDQGSIFSQETRERGYWRPRKQKAFFCFILLRQKMYALSYEYAKKHSQNLDKSPISR